MTDKTTNDGSYWDGRFATDWESFEGPRQSRFFAELAIDHLPKWLLEQIRRHALTVADWGCAQGDGTDVWASYMDARQITGIDFSSVAITQASERYPAIRFINNDWLDPANPDKDDFDVVFSSNTLEHFHRPYDVLNILGKKANKAIVLALPYREKSRISEHFYSFLPENIPLVLSNGFRLVWSQVIDCRSLPDTLWNGDQIFLVYAQPQWLDGVKLNLNDVCIESDGRASQFRTLNSLLEERNEQIKGFLQSMSEHDAQVVELTQSILKRDTQIVDLNGMMAEKDHQIIQLKQCVKERDGYIAEFNESMAKRDTCIGALEQSVKERDARIGALQQSLDERNNEIFRLNQTIAERNQQAACDAQVNALLNANRDSVEAMRNTHSWRITRPLRFSARMLRYGLLEEDKRKIEQDLRTVYKRLPLPSNARNILRWAYRQTVGASYVVVRKQILSSVPFQTPSSRPIAQESGACDYIIWGVIDWHFRHQRPQQLAQALAASGRRVFYISANLIDDARPGFRHESLDHNSRLYQINLFAEGAPVIYTSAPGHETVIQLRSSMADVLAWANSRQIVSLVQHPFWYDVASVLPNSRLVYDCMDHHEGFGNTADAVLALERALMRNADLTITTSAWLDNIVAEHTPHRALIRNAGEFAHFSRKPDVLYADPQGRRVIGYYGAIAEWFDLELVEAIARKFVDCCVLLIGDDTVNAKARFKHLPNIVMTGEIPYMELPRYLHAFDVCLLPFKVIPLTLATNPVKVYEYLSAGKAVVSVDLPEMQQFGGLVRVAKNTEGFLSAVADVLDASDALDAVQKRQEFAREQTWTHRALALVSHAESKTRDPMVSVIVVTYNNLEFTRACLSSLDKNTDHDFLEIIVVDNNSSDDSAAFLKEWVAGASNRKLILNADNRGFAAANNQGLVVAAGDYLVLLNNDTYVTPGWVRTLFRHLQRDPSIGLIGPVTNNIGNEAKIDIHYQNMEEMVEVSGEYVRRHLGQTFPLHTAAFFCVMFSRSLYEKVGPLDEAFGRGFFEDDDYCRRIEQIGLRVVCAEDVFIHHHLSASFNKLKSADRQALFEQNKLIYEAKWGKWTSHAYRN